MSDATTMQSTCFSVFSNVRVTGSSTQTPFQVDRPAAIPRYARRGACVGPSVPRRQASARLDKNDKASPADATGFGGSSTMGVEYSAGR